MEFVDRQISCLDCGQPFTFTAGEQEFYSRKGFKEEPKRCKPCRDLRKTRRNGPPSAAAGYVPDGNSVGNGDFAVDDDIGNRLSTPAAAGPRGPREVREVRTGTPRGRSAGGGGGAAPRDLYDAVCAQCGAATRVPFKPAAGRPVYCRDCYANRGKGLEPL